jgi:hypothetical protein
LLKHPEIPSRPLAALQRAVTKVKNAADRVEAAKLLLAAAELEIPTQPPAKKSKRDEWEKMKRDREGVAAKFKECLHLELTALAELNAALRKAVEKFRPVAMELYNQGDSEPARSAALNVLACDEYCAAIELLVAAESEKGEPSLLERLMLRQLFMANQRHYTVRVRIDSAKWAYVQSLAGSRGFAKPTVPLLTIGEAEEECRKIGDSLAEKLRWMSYEIEIYDLVNNKQTGTRRSCNSGVTPMPPAED